MGLSLGLEEGLWKGRTRENLDPGEGCEGSSWMERFDVALEEPLDYDYAFDYHQSKEDELLLKGYVLHTQEWEVPELEMM